jgi:hypothetical protein
VLSQGRVGAEDHVIGAHVRSHACQGMGTHGILLPVSLKRIAPNAVVASYTRGLQVVATSRRVVSNDGRVMTVTTVSRDRTGKTVTNIGVYERQK